MKINRNMSAVIANNQLLRTENKLKRSMERLSSGLKLNSAGDNPAGMAISNKMKAQIDALDKAESNTNDGVSLLQIADGALSEMTNVLQRMRELAVQAANDTNTYEDKKTIQDEIDQLKNEIDRIASDTEYNTKTLLDGSSDTRVYSAVKDSNGRQSYTDAVTRMYISDQVDPGNFSVKVDKAATNAKSTMEVTYPFPEDGSLSINGIDVEVKADMTEDEFNAAVKEATIRAGVNLALVDDKLDLSSQIYGAESNIEIKISANIESQFKMTEEGVDLTPVIDEEGNSVYRSIGTETIISELNGDFDNATYTTSGTKVMIKGSSGFEMEFSVSPELEEGAELELKVTEIGKMMIQSGANQYQNVGIRIPAMTTDALYLDTVDVSVEGGAGRAISAIDAAVAKMTETRSRIGAYQNRLEYAANSLAETGENLTAAFAQLTDVDMAKEYTEYASQNVLNQAGVSVLSQANDLPKQVLSLLS